MARLLFIAFAAGGVVDPHGGQAALSVGRGARYLILAYLGAHYGRHIVSFFARYYAPALIILLALSVIGAGIGWFEYRRARKTSATQAPPMGTNLDERAT